MSKLLYSWDSVQCALALEKYDVTVHQPHPPGFFLYVMLGRFFNLFIEDANTLFVLISILFSGLAVVAIYYLGRELFHEKLGIIAAAIAITSPNIWFHGEIAFIYIVDSFFTTVIAFFCWKTYKGEHKYIWLSAIALGIAGGMRIYTLILLFPLWIFSLKGVSAKNIFASFGVLLIVCLLWFVPMLYMTGGWNAYKEAYRELLLLTALKGLKEQTTLMRIYSSPLFLFLLYGIGAGIILLVLSSYSLIRQKKLHCLDKHKIIFILVWIMPSVFFYLWVGLHPTIPGYALIILPALFILIAVSIEHTNNDLKQLIKKDLLNSIVLTIMIINSWLFFFSFFQTSYREIKDHDSNLSIVLDAIKEFNPENTAIFVGRSIFYGFRHFQFYLPNYKVYQVDERIDSSVQNRKQLWAMNRETFASEELTIPANIHNIAIFAFNDVRDKALEAKGAQLRDFSKEAFLVSGPITLVREIYPHLRINFDNPNGP